MQQQRGEQVMRRRARPALRIEPRGPAISLELSLEPASGHILLAEDDPDLRSLIAAMLRLNGYDVTEAVDGIDALRQLDRMGAIPGFPPIDLIISDLQMPGRSGLDVVSALRGDGLGIPCILMTGCGDDAVREEARNLGVWRVLSKPLDLGDLEHLVLDLVPRPPVSAVRLKAPGT